MKGMKLRFEKNVTLREALNKINAMVEDDLIPDYDGFKKIIMHEDGSTTIEV